MLSACVEEQSPVWSFNGRVEQEQRLTAPKPTFSADSEHWAALGAPREHLLHISPAWHAKWLMTNTNTNISHLISREK